MSANEEKHVDVAAFPAANSEQLDWNSLRQLSLRPGGFRDRRVELWTKLLHVHPLLNTHDTAEPSAPSLKDEKATLPPIVEPHPDERQVRLDTDRSFVLYPVGDMKERQCRQNELHDLIVEIFRKRRKLSYFQGYHDIISVLFLTLPKELQLPAAEHLSLHRLRDSMGASLEPVVGLLRILKRILDVADPEYSASLNQVGKMPYYALSNLLTLFSHDMPTLYLIQHVFDYLLCRHPIAVVYLAAAVLLARKAEVQRLQEEDEDGMIHSLLSSLPDIYDDDENGESSSPPETVADVAVDCSKPGPIHETSFPTGVLEEVSSSKPSDSPYDEALLSADESETDVSSHPDDATLVDESSHTSDVEIALPSVLEDDPTLVSDEIQKMSQHLQEPSTDTAGSFQTAPEVADPAEPTLPDEPTSVSTVESGVRRPRIHISTLFEKADELLARYPPTEPPVSLHDIMGPNSVMRTWSEDPALLPLDDAAEFMVINAHSVVLPPPIDEDEEKAEEMEEEQEHVTRERERRHRRRLRKPRRMGSMTLERKTVVSSAVIVLVVAMAVYGMQASPERHHSHAAGRELRRAGKFFGGFVVGMGGRLWEGLVAMAHV